MINLVHIADKLGEDYILVTADMQAKPQEFGLNSYNERLRVGGMDFAMAFLACPRNIYGDGGLHDILTESNSFAEATGKQILQWKQYARGIRAMKLVQEVFTSFFSGIGLLLEENGRAVTSTLM